MAICADEEPTCGATRGDRAEIESLLEVFGVEDSSTPARCAPEASTKAEGDDPGVAFRAIAVLGAPGDSIPSPSSDEVEREDLTEMFETTSVGLTPRLDSEASPESALSSIRSFLAIATRSAYNVGGRRRGPGRASYQSFSTLRVSGRGRLEIDVRDGLEAVAAVRGFRDYIYAAKGRDRFADDVLDEYESDVDVDDLFFRWRASDSLDFTVGRQRVVWGALDDFRVVDVLNPLDLREPGQTDLRDLRLPVASTRVDYSVSSFQLTGVVIHETRFDDIPVPGGEFFPDDEPLPAEQVPGNGGGNTEYGLRLGGSFEGFDAAVQFARVFDDSSYFDAGELRRRHARTRMVGFSLSSVSGDLLFKADAAHISGLKFFGAPGETRRRIDIGAGLEYTGLTDIFLSAELVARRLDEFGSELRNDVDQEVRTRVAAALRGSWTTLRGRLTLNGFGLALGPSAREGSIIRLDAEYSFTDAARFKIGALLYPDADELPFEAFDRSDRIFLEFTYDVR